jgi:ribonucleotide reductase beta subunit family protein with ferritin-like domain
VTFDLILLNHIFKISLYIEKFDIINKMEFAENYFTDLSQKRLVLHPIQHKNLWNIFKEQQSVLWTTEEIDWGGDLDDWATLPESEQNFILHILAFFASSDSLVVDNLMDQFMAEITVAEARSFYTLQGFIETIHSETYSTALEKFAPAHRKKSLFTAVQNEPTTKAKAKFAQKYMDPIFSKVYYLVRPLHPFIGSERSRNVRGSVSLTSSFNGMKDSTPNLAWRC